MLIKNIKTQKVENDKFESLQAQFDKTNFINVSDEIIERGDKYVKINGINYDIHDFDTVVTGNAQALYQTGDKLVVEIDAQPTDYHIIYPVQNKRDFNVVQCYFKPAKGAHAMEMEKVVGTTFSFEKYGPRKYDDFAGVINNDSGTPTLVGQALLIPQPDNQYDKNAIAVIAAMKDDSSFPLGYLSKQGVLYHQIKQPTMAKLEIFAYSENGQYNDSYVVSVVK